MDTDYQNKHYNINQKDEGTYDDRGRYGGTNFVLRINASAWGHLNPNSYCDVGRLFTGYLIYGLNCREKMKK